MTVSTKFSRLVSNQTHLQMDTQCIEFKTTNEFLNLNTEHKGVIKATLKKTAITQLESLLNIEMPVGHRYEIKKHCDNPNCVNPYHMTFEKKEAKDNGIANAQKALWADDEHRADRVNKIKERHQSSENRAVHSNVYKKMHENNYDVILQDNTMLTNLSRQDAKEYIIIGARLANRNIVYLSNTEFKQNKKFSIMGSKGKDSVVQHLKNGWDIGYSSLYETVPASHYNKTINDLE